jgi:fatty-acyl-CoA synthase
VLDADAEPDHLRPHAGLLLLRNAQGRCIRCGPDEVGEAIGRISEKDFGSRFEGYTDGRESERKVLRDAFEAGDAWFRTGDLMRKDAGGYFYFVDRIGDTFRWKGENVSTAEVADAITVFPGIIEANVYGVPVPGTEGKAGMAAVVVDSRFDLASLRIHLIDRLPEYARPLFLRIRNEMEVTVTFKHRKKDLAHEGYDPAGVEDVIYFSDPRRRAFVRLDRDLFEQIQTGEIRL